MTATVRNETGRGTASQPRAAARLRLDALLAVKALEQPNDSAFLDQPGRAGWCDRPPAVLSFAEANTRVDRLARFLAGLGLAAASPVAVALANGSEACLAILACQRAGLRPCLVSPACDRQDLVEAVASIGAEAIVSETRIGSLRPAELFCDVAASFFGLRFVCAFGRDVPDGVVALDAILDEDTGRFTPLPAGCPSLITFDRIGGRLVPVGRQSDAIVAAALPLAVIARIGPAARLVSMLAPDDLAGLATGLALALATGAALCAHGIFDSGDLLTVLDDAPPAHLVVPAWFERPLTDAGLVEEKRLASLVLVHRPPLALVGRSPSAVPVIDALALGEVAFAAAARRDGVPAFRREFELLIPAASAAPLTALRVAPSGVVEVRGRGTASTAVGSRARPGELEANVEHWRATRFSATLTGDRIATIREAETTR